MFLELRRSNAVGTKQLDITKSKCVECLEKKKKVIPLSKQLDIAKSSTNYINFIRTVEIFKRNK